MIIVGLTGSIGMGKSETAKMFVAEGVPVFDADAAVHRLQKKGGKALPLIEKAFPGSVAGGELDRASLGAQVFADPAKKKVLENIMHPMVGDERIAFFEAAEKANADIVVLDVPLLFETGGDKGCHYSVVVSAPAEVQRERVLARSGMTAEKFEDILKRQMPDADKRAKADYIVDTDKGLEHAKARVREILTTIRNR
ncbi:dephospho-CoA kinase [Kordiimonas laminariae]|uniref:dephospho-CoA kinase n=1 Tax=Kordiimonas laminariae TaxID=2917717 RepID=UPI001FF25071|nr:dephospho-CoA kinase [Kordiimonas laminariae]MCK0070148.1 dephospho-CoA kinase [Kordiimonas laminariae]